MVGETVSTPKTKWIGANEYKCPVPVLWAPEFWQCGKPYKGALTWGGGSAAVAWDGSVPVDPSNSDKGACFACRAQAEAFAEQHGFTVWVGDEQ